MVFKWGSRRAASAAAAPSTSSGDDGEPSALRTKALRKFLQSLAGREAPVLVDLGPVVGSNVSFFGERLGCKILVEDVFAEIERAAKAGHPEELGNTLVKRCARPEGSVDGILCWDIFDYLDKATAQRLAKELVRMLSPGGTLLAFFATIESSDPTYTRYVVIDEEHLQHRSYPASNPRRHVLANRDINRMFEGLNVVDSFLLLTKTREMTFRKAVAPLSIPSTPPSA